MSDVKTASANVIEKPKFKDQYENFIGGKWTSPVKGQYFENVSPVDGANFTKIPRSTSEDIEKAIDAAWEAAPEWNNSAAAYRSNLLLKIADVMEQNLEALARAETWDNGKAIRETMAADLPLAVDHFRYFAGVIRAEEGSVSELDSNTVCLNVTEPLGVVGQIIPWNFPLLMATWKLAPALAAGNCVVLKPAEQTPVGILILMELIEDILPAGVLNIVNGFGAEAGKPLASSPRINKIAFTGETTTGQLIMQYASKNITPVTLELGGKSPNVFFESVMDADDDFFDKCLEGATLFALNQGEVCTCPSRLLVQESIFDAFVERVVERTKAIKLGHPLSPDTMMGAQASNDQYEKILNYINIGKDEGAEVLCGGGAAYNEGLEGGYYIQPTILKGNNKMRVFQEEIFGPVLCVTSFKDEAEAIEIANDTPYGLTNYIQTKDKEKVKRVARKLRSGMVDVNGAGIAVDAPFGGFKHSGIGREAGEHGLEEFLEVKSVGGWNN